MNRNYIKAKDSKCDKVMLQKDKNEWKRIRIIMQRSAKWNWQNDIKEMEQKWIEIIMKRKTEWKWLKPMPKREENTDIITSEWKCK